jgi:hypothetical protein
MAEEKKLKMKFKLHQLEFEVEGDQETVKEQFENFKSFITGDLLPVINIEKPKQTELPELTAEEFPKQVTQAEDISHSEIIDIPTLKDIKLRDMAKTEKDWMIVYSFLAADGGNKTFTRADIVELYKESGRYSDKIANGLSQYFKTLTKDGIIKATSDTEFIILDDGKSKANQIFQGNSQSKSSKSTAKISKSTAKKSIKTAKKPSSNKRFEFTLDKNLNLRPDGKESLIDFATKYDINSTPKQIILIIHYLKNILGEKQVSGNQIYTGLDSLGVRIPESLKQILINTKGRRHGWIDYENMEDISLSQKGKNVVKHDLPKK